MTERDFCLWLNGFVELTDIEQPSVAQWKMIKEHLGLVFNKVTQKLDITVNPANPDTPIKLPVQPYDFPKISDRAGPFPSSPSWMTKRDGTPWPPGTIIC